MITGAEKLTRFVDVGGFYAHEMEIKSLYEKSFANWVVSPPCLRRIAKKLRIKPALEKISGVEIIELKGHTRGAHIGVKVSDDIFLVGDAIETPYSLECADDVIHPIERWIETFRGNPKEQRKTLMRLIDFARQGILLLSSHDSFILPTGKENFIGSQQEYRARLRQQKVIDGIIRRRDFDFV